MRWIWYVLSALWVLDALRMRARLKSIPVLPSSGGRSPDGFAFQAVPPIVLDGQTKASAALYAQEHDVALVDVVPFDTPTELALGIAQLVDTKQYRISPIGPGHSTGFALGASCELLARSGTTLQEHCDPLTLVRTARRLKMFATKHAAVVIAPSLSASGDDAMASWPLFSEMVGGRANSFFAARALVLIVLLAGLVVAPAAGATAMLVMHLQPLLVFAGLPLQPRDLWRTVALRTPLQAWTWWRTLRSRMLAGEAEREALETRRSLYVEWMKDGLDRFFEPRRENCPICGSRQLHQLLKTIDVVQRKPGQFVLDECEACGHIFQNPRLSAAGLGFYYSDFYDGMCTPVADTLMRAPLSLYLDRARLVEGLTKPSRWLDVGTAHGHFCCAAHEAWPDTRFDGLDLSSKVEEAERAGWVGRAYRGSFADLADDLAGGYDVLSLFHCLEHSPDPRTDLAAAYTALEPGGLLVIEVPDPECYVGRILGRFWFPWFQPQHLHLLSVKNLTKLLREAGFEPAVVQRGQAHIQVDFFCSLMVFYGWLAPRPDAPWLPPSSAAARWRHRLVWRLGLPLIPVSMFLDVVTAPLARRVGLSNAYRIVARRDAKPLLQRAASVDQDTLVVAHAS